VSYWALNAVFLAVVLVVTAAAVAAMVVTRRRRPGADRGRMLGAFGITLAVLLVLTAVFDNVMIGVGLVGYDPALISGAFVGIAPLEDFAYAMAAVLLLPSLWLLLGARQGSGSSQGTGEDAS
jgi:lycopene cyclase domain-containing protein